MQGGVITTLCWDPIAPGILMLELHLPIIIRTGDVSAPSIPTPALQAVQGRTSPGSQPRTVQGWLHGFSSWVTHDLIVLQQCCSSAHTANYGLDPAAPVVTGCLVTSDGAVCLFVF